ncbi:MAG: BACON domain-containing protein [Alistipes sp.]|nr:BACON domain-containing protein [Alistipes sp.]
MKLNKLFYLLVAVCAIFTACGDDSTEGTQQETVKGNLVVEEKSISVEFYGGDAVINYFITEAPEGAAPTATATADWINDIVAANDELHFNVELNETFEARTASINVKYGKQSYDVFVRQEAGWEVDVEFTAGAINGEYYGTKYGDPNYYVILSTYGTTGYMDLPFVDSYYRLDMFSTTPAGDVLALPQGVYKYDYLAQGIGDSFGGQYSWLFQTLATGGFNEAWYDDGVVIVTENKVEAYFKFTDGKVHHVVYEGSLELGWLQFEDPDFFSTLESDMTVNEIGGHLRLINYGDVFGIGANNWSVSMAGADEMNYNYFMLDVITDDMSTSIDSVLGTYTVAVDNAAKNTFLAGALDGTQYVGSWYTGVVDGYVDHGNRAPLTGGTITIAKEGTNYVVTYDCVDDNGHKITGTYSCIDVVDYTNQQ